MLCADHPGLVDLHTHTTCSDGVHTPSELVRLAREAGVGTLAITDHDSMDGVDEGMRAARVHGIQILPGVEVTAHLDGDGEVHVLAYFLRMPGEAFRRFLARTADGRRERILAMIEALARRGVEIDPDTVIPEGTRAPGRPHLARALIEAGHARNVHDVYARFLGLDCGAYVPKRTNPVDGVLAAIHGAGGAAVLAHPGRHFAQRQLDAICSRGFDGIEVYHGRQGRSLGKRLRGFAMSRELLVTGGSDFHGAGVSTGISVATSTLPASDLRALLEHLERRALHVSETGAHET